MRTREIEISDEIFKTDEQREHYGQYVGTYLIKEWSFGDREQVLEEASETEVVDGSTKFKIKPSKTRVSTIKVCLVEAPFKVNLTNIKAMPSWLAEYLYEEIDELNSGDEDLLEALRKK